MMDALLKGDAAIFETSLKELFSNIPYQLHIKREAYYHSMLLLWLNMLGFHVEAEVSTNKGRIDAVWTWKERAVIADGWRNWPWLFWAAYRLPYAGTSVELEEKHSP